MASPATSSSPEDVRDVQQTTCVVVGGGPAGVVLSLLLARAGVNVTLLEAHLDFDRDFRGDTLHPSVLEIMEQLGLAERLHELRHTKIHSGTISTADGPFTPIDFHRLKTRFPYIMLVPQATFLEFLTEEARKCSTFRIVMGANVQRLVEEDGVVRGVRYRGTDSAWHEVRAHLTVAADGRFSRLRHLAELKPIVTSTPMDVLWFRLPRLPEDPGGEMGIFGRPGGGRALVVFDRHDYWQVGFIFPKGGYQQIRAGGIEGLRAAIVEREPAFRAHVQHLTDWREVALLSVESSRLRRWYKPGLLFIGDAAHVMTPVGGIGINYAVQDAVVAANVLAGPLRDGNVRQADLVEVQRQREWPTWIAQTFQSIVQRQLVARVLASSSPEVRVPRWVRWLLRIPIVRDLPARFIAFGPRKVRVKEGLQPCR